MGGYARRGELNRKVCGGMDCGGVAAVLGSLVGAMASLLYP